MSETQSVPPMLNKTMKFILRSPLHGIVSKYILLITFTGRKSGKTYTTPVSYSQQDERVTIFTHASWWKNLYGGAQVSLRIRGREYMGTTELVSEDKDAIIARLTEHLQKSPFDARYYDVGFDDQGNPRAKDIKQAVQTVVMIQIQLC